MSKKRSNKADRAPSELENSINSIPKKIRIMNMLSYAFKNGTTLTIRDLEKVASRGYIYGLLKDFEQRGFVSVRIQRTQKGKTKGWLGTETLNQYISSQSSHKEGLLPRGVKFGEIARTRALKKRLGKKKKGRESKIIQVVTKDASRDIGIDYAYTEHIQVVTILDPAVAKALRTKLNPPSKGDHAKQYSLVMENLSLSISNRDKTVVELKTKQWADQLAQLCVLAGISKKATKQLIADINMNIPDGTCRVEFPVFLQQLNDLEVSYEMRTEIFGPDGETTGYIVQSNINRSMLVDYEVLGKVYAVDSFLSTMSAMQNNAAVNYASIKIQHEKEAQEREDKRKAAEAEMDKERIKQEVLKEMEEKKAKERTGWEDNYI